jgi:hypothetical protein
MFEFLIFENRIFQPTLSGEMTNTEVVDLKKLYNYVADNIFV